MRNKKNVKKEGTSNVTSAMTLTPGTQMFPVHVPIVQFLSRVHLSPSKAHPRHLTQLSYSLSTLPPLEDTKSSLQAQ